MSELYRPFAYKIWEEIGDRVKVILDGLTLDEYMRFPAGLIERFSNKVFCKEKLTRFAAQVVEANGSTYIDIGINKSKLHLEGDINICLSYEDIVIATVWINIDSWLIIQVQASKTHGTHSNFYVDWFDWSKVLLTIAKQYFESIFHRNIALRQVDDNYAYDLSEWGFAHGKKLYDDSARELWIPVVSAEPI